MLLFMFILRPVRLAYIEMIKANTLSVLGCASTIIIVSSAYWIDRLRWNEYWPMHRSNCIFISQFNESATIIKSIGDRGSPCLNPLSCLKNAVRLPLTLTVEYDDLSTCSIEEVHFGGKPLSISRLVRKHQLTVSKAFSKSTLYKIDGIFFWCMLIKIL